MADRHRLRIPAKQGVQQRAAPIAGRGMHHQPRRLVDHEDVLILIHHIQWPLLGPKSLALLRRAHLDRDAVPGLDPGRGLLYLPPIQAYAALEQQLLQITAGKLWDQFRECLVQPLSMLLGAHDDLPQFRLKLVRLTPTCLCRISILQPGRLSHGSRRAQREGR